MYRNQEEEIEHLLQRETDAKRYMLISFMFGVFLLATLKDFISSGGLESFFAIVRIVLFVAFLILTIYFYFQADSILDEEELDKLDIYREEMAKEQKKDKKETFVDKFLNKPNLQSFKRFIYIFWAIIFVIFIVLAVLSFGGEPTEEPTDGTTKTTTTTAPATVTSPVTTTK